MTNPSPPLLDARSMVHHIRGVAWVPAEKAPGTNRDLEDPTLVSHGYENVRFWRLRQRKGGQGRKLHVCGMPLQHHEGEMFLDVAIDAARAGGGGEHGLLQRRMLVGSSSGKLFQVDVSTRSLEYVFQLHDAPINTVRPSAPTTPTPTTQPRTPTPTTQPLTLNPPRAGAPLGRLRRHRLGRPHPARVAARLRLALPRGRARGRGHHGAPPSSRPARTQLSPSSRPALAQLSPSSRPALAQLSPSSHPGHTRAGRHPVLAHSRAHAMLPRSPARRTPRRTASSCSWAPPRAPSACSMCRRRST